MSESSYKTMEYGEIGGFIIYGIIATIVLPLVVGFALGGFSESFVSGRAIQFGDFLLSYLIYYIFIVGALFGTSTLKFRELLLTKKGEHPWNQRKAEFFNVAIIHDPEQDGLLYNANIKNSNGKNFMNWSKSWLMLAIASILFFGILGILQSVYSFSFVGIPQQTLQQVTKLGSIIFSVEPAAFAETLLILFIFYGLMSLSGYLSSKYKWGKGGYFFMNIIFSFIVGTLWMGLHSLVYGSSESALIYTFIFGVSICILTLLFGSFLPAYFFHVMNNLFVALNKVYSTTREDVIMFSVLGLFIILFLWIAIGISIKNKRKKLGQKIIQAR